MLYFGRESAPSSISMAVCMELMGQSKKGKIYQISELRSVSEKREKPGDASSELGERHLRAIFISELGDFVSPSSGRNQKVFISRGVRGMPRSDVLV